MSRTVRTVTYRSAKFVELLRDPRYPARTEGRRVRDARIALRVERGADGTIVSDNLSARTDTGRLDTWTTVPKGRDNKRGAQKAIRNYYKNELRREMD